jgi:AraC-like DNA-binding protein
MAPDPELLQLAGLFDCVEGVLVWVKDRQGRYCWVNRAFRLGYEAEHPQRATAEELSRIIGKTDYDLSPAFLADQFRLDDEQVLAGNPVVNRIELVGPSEGEAAWHVTNKIPLRDRPGAIVGVAGLTRPLRPSEQEGAGAFPLGRVLAHLRDHHARPLTNEALAAVAHMSLRAFERNFRRSFHLTPQHYVRRLRLRMASRALVFTDQSLARVAQVCGFSDQSHFTREFRRHFGRTPRDYRAHYAQTDGFAAPGIKSAAPGQSGRRPPG